ncbi:hypothetical protein J6E39_09430 [bacterium]|nr:hypothetical protein [bacterium]
MKTESLGYSSDYSSKVYNTIANFCKNKEMSPEDELVAKRGFTFLKYPTSMPDGINTITQGGGGGMLNMQSPSRAQVRLYEETGTFGESTFMAFG